MDRAPRVDESKDKTDAASARLRLLGVPCLHRADGSVHFLERLEAALLWPRVATERMLVSARPIGFATRIDPVRGQPVR